jgi:hypothetical protein
MDSTAGLFGTTAPSPTSFTTSHAREPRHAGRRRFVRPRRRALVTACSLLFGAAASFLTITTRPPAVAALPAPAAPPVPPVSYLGVDEVKLGHTLCALKEEVRFRDAAWSPATCQTVARAVLSAAAKYRLSPALILGVMLNESDLDENARTAYRRGNRVYATDSGLMGIRCEFDRNGRCRNGHVRGMDPRQVIDPATNIALGAHELAYTRDRGGVERRTVAVELDDGGHGVRRKLVRCRHRTHAYWAHYNHGSFYISRGFPRHYGHRVGVLYYAFARTLGLPDREVTTRPLTVRDPGGRVRTADRPVEARFRKLTQKIYRAAEATTFAGIAQTANLAAPSSPLASLASPTDRR